MAIFTSSPCANEPLTMIKPPAIGSISARRHQHLAVDAEIDGLADMPAGERGKIIAALRRQLQLHRLLASTVEQDRGMPHMQLYRFARQCRGGHKQQRQQHCELT